ncbi:DNA-directed DNA polymerase [Coemansia sp. Cherry 401B]|nr:DNA-directed DNA polymerase [Coemansia sp. Cherry 401B]
MPTTLEYYWDLASLDEGKRISAAAQLISTLCRFQAEMPATDEVATTEADMNRICAGDVSYAVKRLIKGLASSRDGARQGYSVALAELLGRVPCITVKLVLDLLWQSTEATKGMKGQEQRDMRFGRIFGLMALVQSGIVTRASTTAVDMRKIVMELAAIGAKQWYLREIAYVTLTSMVPMLGKFGIRDELITMFVAVALDKGAVTTADELLLALRLRRQYPGYDWHTALGQWHGRHMLGARNAGRVAQVLCEQTEGGAQGWCPQLHSVWDEIFDLYFNRARADEVAMQVPMEFELLWERVVEQGLFAPGATQGRRHRGFMLLERLLPHLSEETVPALMTPNVVRAMSDNVSAKAKSPLAQVGLRTVERLSVVCEGNPKVGLAVLTHLLNQKSTIGSGERGSLRTLMANRIVATLDSEAIVGYVEYLQQVFTVPGRARGREGVADPRHVANVSEKSVEKQRAWAVDQMIRVARFGQLPITDELTTGVLRFVAMQAAFSDVRDAKAPAPPLTAATRDYCALALVNLVGELSRQAEPSRAKTAEPDEQTGAARGAAGRARDGTAWATAALALVADKAPRGAKVVLHGFGETRAVLGEMLGELRAMAKQAGKLKGGAAQRVQALELLLGNVCVAAAFAANPQTQAEYLEVAPEVRECYRRLAGKAGDGPEPVEVLTDILLSLLTRESSALRRLCDQTFVPFAEVMTAPAVDAIVDVLRAREGGSEGVEVEPEALDDDAMDVDMSDASDVSDAEPEAPEIDEELRRRIEEALGSEGDAGEASASGEEETFDDEQMKVFDDKLAEIFRHKKQQKTWVRELKLSFVNFKLRVLDLADVFLARQGDSALGVRVVAALVDLVHATQRSTRSRVVHDRAAAILGSRLAKVPAGADTDAALELLRTAHTRARQAADRRELDTLGSVAAYAARAALDSGSAVEPVQALYAESARDFMARKASQLQVGFFRASLERLRADQLHMLWAVARDTLEQFGHPLRAVNVYRQVQAFALADAVAATAGRADAGALGSGARELLAALRGALLATLEFAVADANRNAATGKLLLDASRLREIVNSALQVVRRVGRSGAFGEAMAVLAPDAAWTQAVEALQTSDKLASPVIKNLARRLVDLTK